jgi:hypothetical protein
MDITPEEASDRLEAADFQIFVGTDEFIQGHHKSRHEFLLTWQSNVWAFCPKLGHSFSVFKVSLALASVTQAALDFYALYFSLDFEIQQELRIMLFGIQRLRLVIDICDAATFRVRIPALPDDLTHNDRAIASPSLAYRDEVFYIHLPERSWSFERRISTETQFMMPLLHLDEVVPALRPFCGPPTATAAHPPLSRPHRSIGPSSSPD